MSAFLGKQPQARQTPSISGVQLQTSALGKAIPLVFGATRLAPNLIWFGDFQTIAGSSPSAGKGGVIGGGGKGGGTTPTTFTAAVALGVCEGPITGYGKVWADKTITSLAALGLTAFMGTYPQSPWGFLGASHDTGASVEVAEVFTIPASPPYTLTVSQAAQFAADRGVTAGLTDPVSGSFAVPFTRVASSPAVGQYSVAAGVYTFNAADAATSSLVITYSYEVFASGAHPDQAIGYSGLAYLAAASYKLGTSQQLPNHTFEVFGLRYGIAGVPDADPSAVITDLLTNPHFGAGFPAARLGSLATYQGYAIASGLWISPAYQQQASTATILDEIATLTNSEFVWSSGVLSLVPRGTMALAANGYSYTPPSAPLYDLTDDDFLPSTSGANSDPVLLTRTPAASHTNNIKIEYLDRTNSYNPAVVEIVDQALVDGFGKRTTASRQAHLFADARAAQTSAQLQLQKEANRNLYQFTIDERYVLLDPMDIVTLTDARLGLSRQWVRIIEITEANDGTLSFMAEEYIGGTGAPATGSLALGRGFAANYNSDPGNVNPPIFMEPTDALAGDLEVWIAASGGANWGGCDVWVSSDNATYRMAGRISGASRMGVLTAGLGGVAPSPTGPTIDAASTLAVDVSQSGAQLLSGTQQDALAGNTLCSVDGELIAYQTAVLTGPGKYSLSYLNRGMLGSSIAAHPAGAAFLRLDGQVLRMPFAPDRIGSTIYLKFLSFNVYGGGQQQLSQVQPYTYRLQGTAFASPLPNVANLVSSFVAGLTQLSWDRVIDFRPVDYEVRKGASFAGGQVLGRTPNTTLAAQGDGTYWVAAHSSPIAGFSAYSLAPSALVIAGATLTRNVIAVSDEAATGWTGTVSGGAAVNGGAVKLYGIGNILAITDWLHTLDILDYGGVASGLYQIPAAHEVNIGRVAPCSVLVNWASIGQVLGQNILAAPNYLAMTDVLGYQASANVNVYPEIALAQADHVWGAWQKFAPGSYTAQYYRCRMQIQTADPQTTAILSSFVFSVDVPDRIDHYTALAVPAGGLTLTYAPDGRAAAPFNGGNGGSTLPNVQITIIGAQAGDDAILSGQTLAGATVQVVNGGVGVARTVNIIAEGY